jgi:hypothetical protein
MYNNLEENKYKDTDCHSIVKEWFTLPETQMHFTHSALSVSVNLVPFRVALCIFLEYTTFSFMC